MDPSFSIDQSDTTFIIRNSVNKKSSDYAAVPVTLPDVSLLRLTS